jgi:putative hemolysin
MSKMEILPVIIIAADPSKRHEALKIRLKGYRRYFSTIHDASDHFDEADNVTLLLAVHPVDGTVGCMRVLDRRLGPVELDDFLDLDRLLGASAGSIAEATRLSVPPGPHAKVTKLLLWKAFQELCRKRHIERMIVWTRAAASRDYRALLFETLGDKGKFQHPVLGGYVHETFVTAMADVEKRFAAARHPLHNFMFVEQNHEIDL